MNERDRNDLARDEELLRRALNAHADTVDVQPYALTQIRERIASRQRRWWALGNQIPRGGMMAFAGVTATVAAVVIGFASCSAPPPGPGPVPGESVSGEPSASGSAGASPPSAGPVTVNDLAVYYLAQVQGRGIYRLYREFHTATLPDRDIATRARVAVTQMLDSKSPLDPDYTNFWPDSAKVVDVRVEGSTATVNLTGAARADGPPEYVPLALQELVYTVTAADPSLTGVRLEFDGTAVNRLWGAVDTSSVIRRAPASDVIAPVWVISPQHGATVGRTFELHVSGIVFEATANLRIRDRSGKIVREQVLTLSIAGPRVGELKTSIKDLPVGQYTLEAFYFSAENGSVQGTDNKTITVR